MTRNRGQTGPKRRRRTEKTMQDYDHLPADRRVWLAAAVLPWRPKSVRRAFEKAIARTRDRDRALRELDRLLERLLAKDARKAWGTDHPRVAVAVDP